MNEIIQHATGSDEIQQQLQDISQQLDKLEIVGIVGCTLLLLILVALIMKKFTYYGE